MRRLVPILAAVFLLLALIPTVSTWKWNTHGGVYGTRGITKTAYDRLATDPGVPSAIKNNLSWDTIRSGSVAPDRWRVDPYYLDSSHTMTYVENQGGEWLVGEDNKIPVAENLGAWDNVSYYMGIAGHYWGDVTCMVHHDNSRSYYENNFGEELGYDIWDAIHDHFEGQVNKYRPKDPALIVGDGGTPYASPNLFITAAKTQLDILINRTMPDGDNIENGWLWDWINSRKCEASDYAVYHNGNVDNVHYGTKELVDMATELVYSGWVYALDNGTNNLRNSVSADRITWDKWWSREHREPGIVFVGY